MTGTAPLEVEFKYKRQGTWLIVTIVSKVTGNETKFMGIPDPTGKYTQAMVEAEAMKQMPTFMQMQHEAVLQGQNVWLLHEYLAVGLLPKDEWKGVTWDGVKSQGIIPVSLGAPNANDSDDTV